MKCKIGNRKGQYSPQQLYDLCGKDGCEDCFSVVKSRTGKPRAKWKDLVDTSGNSDSISWADRWFHS